MPGRSRRNLQAAFWHSDDSANPDTEILNALRPALATTGGPLIVISSPYARRGEVYTTWRQHFGPDGDPLILVAHGASRDLNATLPQRVWSIRALERDHAAAAAEFLAQFRSDVEALLTVEVIDAATVPGRIELPPRSGVRYLAFTDPSGGSADSYALAICHAEGESAVIDAVRERKPPFSPGLGDRGIRFICSKTTGYRPSRAITTLGNGRASAGAPTALTTSLQIARPRKSSPRCCRC